MSSSDGRPLLRRREFISAAAATFIVPMGSRIAFGQEKFPNGTIDLLVHAGAGGGTDLTALAMIAGGRSELGWPMALVRKTGAGGAVAHQYAKSQPLNGQTVIILTSAQIATIARGKSPIKIDDIVGIARGTQDPNYLVVAANGPYKTAQDLTEAGKDKPMNVGLVSVGGGDHITAFLLSRAAKMKPMQAVPIASGAEVGVNVVGGNLASGIVGISEVDALIKAGKLRPLINFSENRSPELPDVPTARELGYDIVRPNLRGAVVLKGTPPETVQQLQAGFKKILASESYQNYLKSSGIPLDSVAIGDVYDASIRREYEDAKLALTELGLM
jgi:putative tricarboxylic transport membrane protein